VILVIAHAQARPDRREGLIALLAATAQRSRKEPGNLAYRFTSDIEEPNDLLSIEQWESREALDAHMATPELGELLGALGDMVTAAPVITVHEVSGTAPYGG